MNRSESPTESQRKHPSTRRENTVLKDRLQFAREYSHPISAIVGGVKVLNQFLIKRQTKVGT
ncbi:MAG TPA: hypothetical protein DD706_24090 [Nitrospiraceae bacterium]|nr:hypothetical protein [Nitrospiraceae bacterium]